MIIQKEGLLVVFSGPSAVGKGTIVARLLDEVPEMGVSISVTTRGPRVNNGTMEREGREYFFRTVTEFQDMVQKGDILEYAKVHGDFYGTPREQVDALRKAGKDVVLDIDVQGAMQIREHCPDAVLIFVNAPSLEESERRLRKRGSENEEGIATRMLTARTEITFIPHFDYLIVNDDLEEAVRDALGIVRAEKCSVIRNGPRLHEEEETR